MEKKKSRIKYSAMNFVTGVGGSVLTILLSFITRTFFIKVLGKEYLGINGYFSDILKMLSLTELGLDTAMHFRLYKPLADKDDRNVRILMKFYKTAYRIVGAAIFILGLILVPFLKFLIKDYGSLERLGINAILIFILYLLQSVSSYLFFAYRSAVIKADQHEYITNVADYLTVTLSNITQIIVLVFTRDFILYTAVVIVFNILGNLFKAVIAKRKYPQFFEKEEDNLPKEEIVSMLKDCGALFVYKVNGVVVKATDNFVLGYFIGMGMVGLYSNYLLIYTSIRSLLNKFYTSCKASMGNLYVTADVSKSYFSFEIMNFFSILLYGTAGVGIAVVINEFIEFWVGTEYMLPQPVPMLIGIELLFTGIKFNLGQIRNISGAFRQMWYRPLLGIMINIVVSVTLVQFMGISGVLIGTIAADFFANFMVDPSIIHKYSFNGYRPVSAYYIKNAIYFLILGIIGVCDYFICANIFVGKGIFSLLFHGFICGISVPVTFVLLYWKSDVVVFLRDRLRTAIS